MLYRILVYYCIAKDLELNNINTNETMKTT